MVLTGKEEVGFERRSGGDAVEEERRRLGRPAVETGGFRE